MKLLDYIITGTGRCGTVYMAKLLTSVGVPCGHETFFTIAGVEEAVRLLNGEGELKLSDTSRMLHDGYHCTMMESYIDDLSTLRADSSYLAAPFLGHPCLEGTPVIHVVRDPLKVVNSFVNYIGYFTSHVPQSPYGQEYEQNILDILPELADPKLTDYERAALYYIRWNRMIEEKATVRLRAEEGPLPLLRYLGLPPTVSFYDDRRSNSFERGHRRFHLHELPGGSIREEFIEMGRRYGYSMSQNILM